jgi:hypothetical protein
MIKIFTTGFLQVFFVAMNTYFIGKEMYLAVFIVGVLISIVWTYNVKRAAIGSNTERIVYSLGAGIGAVSGLAVSKVILVM